MEEFIDYLATTDGRNDFFKQAAPEWNISKTAFRKEELKLREIRDASRATEWFNNWAVNKVEDTQKILARGFADMEAGDGKWMTPIKNKLVGTNGIKARPMLIRIGNEDKFVIGYGRTKLLTENDTGKTNNQHVIILSTGPDGKEQVWTITPPFRLLRNGTVVQPLQALFNETSRFGTVATEKNRNEIVQGIPTTCEVPYKWAAIVNAHQQDWSAQDTAQFMVQAMSDLWLLNYERAYAEFETDRHVIGDDHAIIEFMNKMRQLKLDPTEIYYEVEKVMS